ncbi:hypothetical protein PABG_11894 [Paracoccidioides brasiliensis Pb03]|nr:hypothetical protein PABG_11894 [Paracoccidioides brasiliensis Pb03]
MIRFKVHIEKRLEDYESFVADEGAQRGQRSQNFQLLGSGLPKQGKEAMR